MRTSVVASGLLEWAVIAVLRALISSTADVGLNTTFAGAEREQSCGIAMSSFLLLGVSVPTFCGLVALLQPSLLVQAFAVLVPHLLPARAAL